MKSGRFSLMHSVPEPTKIRPAPAEPDEWTCTLLRYVEGPDGHMELQETALTPKDFLNPRIGDTWVQGKTHIDAAVFLFDLLTRRFHNRPDALVLHDVKHLLRPRSGPAPDVSVILGLKKIDHQMTSYSLSKIGVPPSLIIEVLSPSDPRIRQVDEVDKLALYERVGVREYLLQDLPRLANGRRVVWKGYRLGKAGRYQPIEPDAQGRLFSETTGLLFGVNPAGNRAEIEVAETRARLLSSLEEQEERLRAEKKLRQETKARKAAETEIARLRNEIKRLRERE